MSLAKEIAGVLGCSERHFFRRINDRHEPTLKILMAWKLAGAVGERLLTMQSMINDAAVELMDVDPAFSRWLEGVGKRLRGCGDDELINLIRDYRSNCAPVDRKRLMDMGWPPSDIRLEETNRAKTRVECLAALKAKLANWEPPPPEAEEPEGSPVEKILQAEPPPSSSEKLTAE
jgi:hypothetical protein